MKHFILLSFFVAIGLLGYSQQQPQFTQYMFNQTTLNPAATGTAKAICFSGAARHQWIGLQDDSNRVVYPRSYLINFEMPLYALRSGIGLSVNYDKLGFESSMDVKLNYAYHQPINKNHVLSIGIFVEIMNKSIDYSNFNVFDSGDPLIDGLGKESTLFADVGLGIYYQFKDKFYGGFSVDQLTGSSGDIGVAEYNLVQHYYFMAGYNFTISENRKNRFVLVTGFLAKSTISSTQLELHAILRYNDRYWSGINYRMEDAIGIVAGMNVNNFSLGLSYDITTSNLSKAGSIGSPELLLKYCIPVAPKVKLQGNYNPRYL